MGYALPHPQGHAHSGAIRDHHSRDELRCACSAPTAYPCGAHTACPFGLPRPRELHRVRLVYYVPVSRPAHDVRACVVGVLKLSALTPMTKVYRGAAGMKMPPQLLEPDGFGFKLGIECEPGL